MNLMYFLFTGIFLNMASLDPYDYDKAWKEVQTLSDNGMPQDALNKTIEIYEIADNEANDLQRTKATVYLSGFTLSSSEDGLLKANGIFLRELTKAKPPYSNIVHSYYAKFLDNYLQNNRYILSQRTETDDDNLLTITIKPLIQKIKSEYMASLDQAEKLKVEVKNFTPLLNEYNEDGRLRNPDLYDVLVSEVLNFYTGNLAYDTDLTAVMNIDKSYFRNAEEFIKIKIETGTEKSSILQLYQDILQYQWSNNKLVPLAHFDLLRLKYAYENSIDRDRKKYFETALKNGIVAYKNLDISSEFQVELADMAMNEETADKFIKAKAICEACLKQFPKSIGAQRCSAMIQQITARELSISTEVAYVNSAAIKYRINSRNLEKVYFKLIEGTNNLKDILNTNPEAFKQSLNDAKPIKSWANDIVNKKDYLQTKQDLSIPSLPFGSYFLIGSDKPDFSGAFQYSMFQVSNLAYLYTSDDKGNCFIIVDRKSGAPVKAAAVEFFDQKYDYQNQRYSITKVGSALSGKDGKVLSPAAKNIQFKLIIKKGKDTFDGTQYHFNGEKYVGNQNREGIEIYTDRAIYRPGQVVYFKAIALLYNEVSRPAIVPNKSITLILNDANGQEVSNITLKSNDWGSASGSFNLPNGRLTGQYFIQTNNGGKGIRVEEYKRPTFEVKYDSVIQAYKLGDKVKISGEVIAFAGNGVSNAKLKYTVFRRTTMPYCYRWYGYPSDDKMVTAGSTQADASGKFFIEFEALDNQENNFFPIYNYDIAATAVDETGESQTQTFTLSLSKKSLFIEENIPDIFDVADKINASLSVKNIGGMKVSEKGNYTLSKLKEDPKIAESNVWLEDVTYKPYPQPSNKFSALSVEKQIIKGSFASGENLPIAALAVGIYKIEATLAGGKADTLTEYFVVTDFARKKFPASKLVQSRLNKTFYAVGDKMSLDFGAGLEKQNVYYLLSRSGNILQQGWLNVAKSAKVDHVISPADKGGLMIQYTYVYNNRSYAENIAINVPWTEKELDITFENFRDKLSPGEQTDFKIKIAGNQKDKVQAEILAAMYDASLDQLQANYWQRILFPSNYGFIPLEAYYFGLASANELNYMWQGQGEVGEYREVIYPILTGPQNYVYYSYGAGPGRARMYKDEAMMADAVTSAAPAAPPSPDGNFEGKKIGDVNLERNSAEDLKSKKEVPVLSPRTNLKETVFFYPHLKTDKEGNVILSFKMNEALTKWKLMVFAHTKELATLYDERFLQTKKEVMINANSPRFVREGDEIFFTARVTNLTDSDISTEAKLDLKDALKDVAYNQIISTPQMVMVSLKKGESKSVAWKINVPVNSPDLLNYTVSAVAGKYTDGESSILPVLSNRILVTETMAMYLKGNEKKTYEFNSLKNAPATQKPYKYSVEISSHPVWYAIQAMPYVIEQDNQSASQLATRYYINGLSRYINEQYPQIQDVFTQWQNKDKDALKSNLEKNGELKNALLEETPWVREAQNEANEKGNIARLFDKNSVIADLAQTSLALRSLQLPDGSYTWFPGGRGDYYTTLYVTEMLGRVSKYDMSGDAINMANQSLVFIDNELVKQYTKLMEDFKKNKLKPEDYQPSSEAILHLFVRSEFSSIPRAMESNAAYAYYYKQMIKYWNKYDIYTQSLLGLVDYRSKGTTYNEISKSIMQKSFRNDELGTYWNVGNGYRWYEMPIERHSAIMEFLNETNMDAASMDEMKVWLLKNKQGNHWSTSKSTAAAIAALMLTRGPKQANLDNDLAVISKVGEVSLPNYADIQAGTAYYKKSWAGDNIDKAKATIYLSNPNDNIAWGAAYYQYFEDINNILATNASPLIIEKQLYKEVINSSGKSLVLIDGKHSLSPGDVLVSRIIVTVDRDMDYIHLKDLRASGLEPGSSISAYKWSGAFGYYESIRDLATHYYIDHLPKGKHVFESRQKVVHRGKYSGGLATIQSFYAPEFSGKTQGNVIEVK